MNELVPEVVVEKYLSVVEGKRLAELESVIEQNFKGFVAVGAALAEIRDRRLYRQDYPTFEEYCKNLWDMSHQRADQLIAAKQVVENLGTIVPKPDGDLTTIVVKNDERDIEIPIPSNEAQARELAKLKPEEQVEVWQRLLNLCKNTGEKLTAKAVKKAVLAYRGDKIDEVVEKTKTNTRTNRTDFQSEAFAEALNRFFDQVRIEKEANWRNTSRNTVFRTLQGLLDMVSEAIPGTMDAQGCQMELSDREKLQQAGFRIFRTDTRSKTIDEWRGGNSWVLYMTCNSAAQLLDEFNKLMMDHSHLRG